jgi:hypothetical protein
VLFEYYVEASLAGNTDYVQASLAASHRVQVEDVALCESVQRGLASAGYDTGRCVRVCGAGEQPQGLAHRSAHNQAQLLPCNTMASHSDAACCPGDQQHSCAERRPARLPNRRRYAPGVEGPMHHFHSLLHADLTATSLSQQGGQETPARCPPAAPAPN